LAVNIDGRLLAPDMRIQTILKNRKFAHLCLDYRREALKIVEITLVLLANLQTLTRLSNWEAQGTILPLVGDADITRGDLLMRPIS
jgi:hypothetical protein